MQKEIEVNIYLISDIERILKHEFFGAKYIFYFMLSYILEPSKWTYWGFPGGISE